MEDNNDHDRDKWQALLYRLQREFDPRYVMKGGAYDIQSKLVLGMAALILSTFMVGIATWVKSKLGL